jgi:hypothetical protein
MFDQVPGETVLNGKGTDVVERRSDRQGNQSGESSRQLDNLAGLWSGNDSGDVRIFANVKGLFPALGHALDAALLLVQLFLPTKAFSLPFFHAVSSPRFEIYPCSDTTTTKSIGPALSRAPDQANSIFYAEADRTTIKRLPAVATAAYSATVSIAVASAEARLSRLSLIHLDIATLEFGIIELPDRVRGLFRSCHLDETEALRLPREFVSDHCCALHLTDLREEFLEIIIRHRVG